MALIFLQHIINIIMKHLKTYAFAVLVIAYTHVVFAQVSPKGIKGRIIDLESSIPIAGASLSINNHSNQSTTNDKGEFILVISKGGKYQIISSYLGYQSDTTLIDLPEGEVKEIQIALAPEFSSLSEVVVSRRREAHSELALLDERRNASLVMEKIGAQELSRKGVGDAATAVSKLSGISKEEGSSQLFVRGLGDRYITTTLNGLPIPSQDPNFKNIDLSIFSTDVLNTVGVDKNYHAGLYGDFGAANIDILSKMYQGDGFLELSLGSNVNTNAIGKFTNFLLPDGPSFFGTSAISIPQDAQGSYHFINSWNARPKTVLPLNFGLQTGKSYQVKGDQRISFFANLSFNNNYGYREGINANVGAQGDPLKSFDQTQYSYLSHINGMFNASYQISNNHHLTYNFLFINSGSQSHDLYRGFIRDAAEENNGLVYRNTFARTALLIQQLLGKHTISDKFRLDWGLGYNNVTGDMPDRTQVQLREVADNDFMFIRVNAPDNHRYNYFLNEQELAANIVGKLTLSPKNKSNLYIGYSGKWKDRSFDVMQLNFDIQPEYRNSSVNPLKIDDYLGAEGLGSFYILKGFAGNAYQYYDGYQLQQSTFARLEYAITEKLLAIVGLRYEHIKQDVDYYSIEFPKGENKLIKNAWLPSLNFRYTLKENQNIRFGASKTYTLPQFKERARFPYEEVTQVFVGNPYLYASDNYSAELKWELFPKNGELIALTGFGKLIQNPINEIMIASATNDISYANTGDQGYVYGLEIELRKQLIDFANAGKLTFGLNAAWMNTHQTFNAEKVSLETNGMVNIDPTHPTSSFTGASDFIMNADVSFHKKFFNQRDVTATLLYNYYGDKIYAIGTGQLGNRIDKGMSTLDFVLKTKLTSKWKLNVSAKNILNPAFERWQENEIPVKIFSYKRGVNFSLGLSYQL